MGNTFRNINYGKVLYEALRGYFSINPKTWKLTQLYRYCACFIQPFVQPFADYDAFRRRYWLIANCKWQIGQLTNVLNFLYDPDQKRIFISQATIFNLSAPKFPYATQAQGRVFGEATTAQVRKFFDSVTASGTIIHVPIGINLDAITADIELIRMKGLSYTIETF